MSSKTNHCEQLSNLHIVISDYHIDDERYEIGFDIDHEVYLKVFIDGGRIHSLARHDSIEKFSYIEDAIAEVAEYNKEAAIAMHQQIINDRNENGEDNKHGQELAYLSSWLFKEQVNTDINHIIY